MPRRTTNIRQGRLSSNDCNGLPGGANCQSDLECGSNYCSGGVCIGDAYIDECGICNGSGFPCTNKRRITKASGGRTTPVKTMPRGGGIGRGAPRGGSRDCIDCYELSWNIQGYGPAGVYCNGQGIPYGCIWDLGLDDCVCENPTMGCCPEKIGRIRDPQIRQRGGRISRGGRTNTNSRFSGRTQTNPKGKSKKR